MIESDHQKSASDSASAYCASLPDIDDLDDFEICPVSPSPSLLNSSAQLASPVSQTTEDLIDSFLPLSPRIVPDTPPSSSSSTSSSSSASTTPATTSSMTQPPISSYAAPLPYGASSQLFPQYYASADPALRGFYPRPEDSNPHPRGGMAPPPPRGGPPAPPPPPPGGYVRVGIWAAASSSPQT